MGSDEVGGLRIPAQHCGLFTIRPTSGRFPSGTINNTSLSWESIPTVLGPMALHLDDLIYLFRSISQSCSISSPQVVVDPSVVPLPFNHHLYSSTLKSKRLRIGYYVHDGFFRATPVAARAVRSVISALEKGGHECVKLYPPSAITPMLLISKFLAIDLNKGCTALREFQGLYIFCDISRWHLVLFKTIPSLFSPIPWLCSN